MTRLYRLDAPAARIARTIGAEAGRDPWQGGYVAPGQFAPVITAGRDFVAGPRPAGRTRTARIVPRLWGVLPPKNADDPARRIASLRNLESPFWIGNLRNSEFRCLVPATAFMAWGSGTDYEGRRLRHWLAPAPEEKDKQEDHMPVPLFAMLGVWKDEEVPAFALVTRDPTGLPRELGARTQPVAVHLRSAEAQAWLHADWARAEAVARTPQRFRKGTIPNG